MDRVTVYSGAIPLDTDILSTNRNAMIALGYLAQAILGTATLVDGLACNPTAPATMSATVGPGSIFQMESIDNTAYGSLAADTSDPLYKHGINPFGSTSFTFTAPASSGQTINYLIEASLVEADTGSTVLPYYNAANPAQPYTGPNNSAAAQTTLRSQRVGLQLKAGAAATTGTQQTPSVDTGWVPLYIVSVNFGQTTVTATSISVHPNAPFINPKLPAIASAIPSVRLRLTAPLSVFVNAGTGNDNNSGLDASHPKATLQAAYNLVANNYDLNGYQVTINVANGTYTSGVVAVGPVPGMSSATPQTGNPPDCINFVGNAGSPSSVIVNVTNGNCFTAIGGAAFTVNGFHIQASGSQASYVNQGSGLYAADGGGIIFANVEFGACTIQINAANLGFISSNGASYSIVGSATAHIQAATMSYVTITSSHVTLTGTPSFSGSSSAAFVIVIDAAFVNANGTTFSGSATGARYNMVTPNAAIGTNGGGANFFPGNAAGTQNTSGSNYT